jgi:cytochrome c oxidase cbb3-type subunit II
VNPGPLVFLAALFAAATSWLGFVLVPQLEIGRQDQVEAWDTGQLYPSKRPGLARQGAEVYRANGCYYCHSQQVRGSSVVPNIPSATPRGFGADVERGWGGRKSLVQSIAQDYLYDDPVMLGSQRVGPDLANIGHRQTNSVWLLTHLYDPKQTSPGSTMPPYRYLFTRSHPKPGEQRAADALAPGTAGSAEDEQIVPTENARALVAYLLSLHSEPLVYPETPPWPKPKPASQTATNAPAATNVPAATNPPASPTAK